MGNIQCVDLKADRNIGEYWEKQFCLMASGYEKCFTPHQWNRQKAAIAYLKHNGWNVYTLPDVTIWTSPGEHHEIKHKNATTKGSYGLEAYRFNVLIDFAKITEQAVYYTIHDHDLAGGKNNKENDINHWRTIAVDEIVDKKEGEWWGYSWVNGEKKKVLIYYWDKELWQPLRDIWTFNDIPF